MSDQQKGNFNVVFEQARDQFLESLPASEQASFTKCASAEVLVADVGKLGLERKDRLWGKRLIGCIAAFGGTLEPYFKVIGIFVQSHPEFAAIVWGAFSLVIKLATNYTSFFSKLAKTLERISHELPHYGSIAVICQGDLSPRLQKCLCSVYVDLLQFFQAVIRVFTKEDGKAKQSLRVTSGLFWKPFDARFDEFLGDLRYHADLVNKELFLVQLQETKGMKASIAAQFEDLRDRITRTESDKKNTAKIMNDPAGKEEYEKALEDLNILREQEIRRWIDPPQFAQEFERAREMKFADTAEWLVSEDMIATWLAHESPAPSSSRIRRFGKRSLWVQGNPGCGKTILAAAAIEELKCHTSSKGARPSVFYFFFRRGFAQLQNSLAPLRSFVAQLFSSNSKNKDIVDRFVFLMDEQSTGQTVATRAELLDLLRLCSDHSGDVILVLDAVDECDDAENLVKDLLLVSVDPSIKFLFFSRPNVDALFSSVPEEQRLNIGGKNSRDIVVFVSAKLDDLVDDELLPSDADIPQLSTHLILGANGMFIWIRLMANFLKSPALTRRQRIEAIKKITVPEGLNIMYDRIIHLISQSNIAEKELASRIISWILFSKRPLTTRELQIALSPCTSPQDDDEDEYADFKRAVIMSCAGLVEVQKTSSPTFTSEILSFQLIHLSAREYIYSHHPYGNAPPSDASVLRTLLNDCSDFPIEMTTRCLQVLSSHLPDHSLSGKQNVHYSPSQNMTAYQIHEKYTFVGYATCYWMHHLLGTLENGFSSSAKFPLLLEALANFLKSKRKIMAYIEAMYVFSDGPPADILDRWCRQVIRPTACPQVEITLLKKIVDDMLELSRFLAALHREWKDQLLQSPNLIWSQTTSFTTSRLVEQDVHTEVRTLILEPPNSEDSSSRYLSKISELSEDGRTVGILSIWPSKAFELSARSSMKPIESMIPQLCTGWVARYELWLVEGEPRCFADASLPLDPAEIQLQFCRSMWQEDPTHSSGHWRIQLPTALDPQNRLAFIIQTVYYFSVATDKTAHMYAVRLPLHVDPDWKSPFPTPQTSEKISFSGLLKPLWGLRRSKSANGHPETFPKQSGSTSSKIWSRSSSRPLSWRPASQRGGPGQLYRHWIAFAHHGTFLFFLDHTEENQQSNVRFPSNLILYKIDAAEDLKISLVASTRMTLCSATQIGPPKVQWHPKESVLVVFFPRAGGGSPVITWRYEEGINQVEEQYRTDAFGSVNETVLDAYFSRDGKHLVVHTSKSPAPEVIPIGRQDIFGHLLGDNEPIATLSDTSNITAMQSASRSTMIVPTNRVPQILKSETDITGTNEASGTSIVYTGREVTIRKWSNQDSASAQGGKEEVLKLLRLPAWSGLSSSSVAIRAPRPDEEKLRVVMNKSARDWEDMVQEVDVNLPAIISRDMRNLTVESSDTSTGLIEDGQKRT